MDIHKVVNLICGIAGIGVVIFAITVKLGMIPDVDPSKSTLPFILGVVIILWALGSHLRHRR